MLLSESISSAIDVIKTEKIEGLFSATCTFSSVMEKDCSSQLLSSHLLVISDDDCIGLPVNLSLLLYRFFVVFMPLFCGYSIAFIAAPAWAIIILSEDSLSMLPTSSDFFFSHNWSFHKECKKEIKVMGVEAGNCALPVVSIRGGSTHGADRRPRDIRPRFGCQALPHLHEGRSCGVYLCELEEQSRRC